MKFLALPLLLGSLHVVAEEMPRLAVVRFNTVCANCHEGECSGRLSFQSGVDAARGHIERYVGKIANAEAEALFNLLRHTKERCHHYPVAPQQTAMGAWNATDLKLWRNPHEGGYFIPLGKPARGSHHLQITFASAPSGHLKITDERFEPLVDQALLPASTQEIRFTTAGNPLYMTLQSKVEATSIRFMVSPPLDFRPPDTRRCDTCDYRNVLICTKSKKRRLGASPSSSQLPKVFCCHCEILHAQHRQT